MLVQVALGGSQTSAAFAQAGASQAAPEIFAPGIISVGWVDTYDPTFTPDGRTVYYTMNIPGGDYAIAESHLRAGRWQQPRVSAFSTMHGDAEPFISPDGRSLFFASRRPRTGTQKRGDFDIWVVDRVGRAWSAPRLVPGVNSDAYELQPSVSRDGTLYFVRFANGDSDIWRARRDGDGYAQPEKLPPVINSDRHEESVYVSPDESYILFDARRAGGLGGSDIYVSYRQGPSWSEPLNLGAKVNSPVNEGSVTLSPNGQWLYLSSQRRFPRESGSGFNLTYDAIRHFVTSPGNGRTHILRYRLSGTPAARALMSLGAR